MRRRRELRHGYTPESDSFPEGLMDPTVRRVIELLRQRGYSVNWWENTVQIRNPRGVHMTHDQSNFLKRVFVNIAGVGVCTDVTPPPQEDSGPSSRQSGLGLFGDLEGREPRGMDQSGSGQRRVGSGRSCSRGRNRG